MNEVTIHIYSENKSLQDTITKTIADIFLKELASGAVESVQTNQLAHCHEVEIKIP